jgi:hypothetical protein
MNATATSIDQQTQISPTAAMELAEFIHMSNALAHVSNGSIRNALGGRFNVIHWVTPHILLLDGTPPQACPFLSQPAPRGVLIRLSGVSSAIEPSRNKHLPSPMFTGGHFLSRKEDCELEYCFQKALRKQQSTRRLLHGSQHSVCFLVMSSFQNYSATLPILVLEPSPC